MFYLYLFLCKFETENRNYFDFTDHFIDFTDFVRFLYVFLFCPFRNVTGASSVQLLNP